MSREKQRPFAVFDIDGTLIRWQLYHAITDNLVKRQVIDGERFETIRGARMDWKRRAAGASFKSYETQVVEAYEQALAKLTHKQLLNVVDEVFEEYKDQVYTYTRDLIKALKSKNYLLFAISGSQTEIVEKVAFYYGFDDFIGTEYRFEDQKYTGDKTFHAGDKSVALARLVKKFNAKNAASVAVGDTLSDIPMLEAVAKPIAFNPEQQLFDYATEKGWKIVVERKNVVFELENADGGYRLAKTNQR